MEAARESATRGVESRFRLNQQVKERAKQEVKTASETQLFPHISQ